MTSDGRTTSNSAVPSSWKYFTASDQSPCEYTDSASPVGRVGGCSCRLSCRRPNRGSASPSASSQSAKAVPRPSRTVHCGIAICAVGVAVCAVVPVFLDPTAAMLEGSPVDVCIRHRGAVTAPYSRTLRRREKQQTCALRSDQQVKAATQPRAPCQARDRTPMGLCPTTLT